MSKPIIDLAGQRFGNLTIIKKEGYTKHRNVRWLCICDCGGKTIASQGNLKQGHVKSCGCAFRTARIRQFKIHPDGEAAFNALYCSYKIAAKKHNLEWALTKREVSLLTQMPCYYCGQEPTQIFGKNRYNGSFLYNGIDRIESNHGYLNDNVVSCCGKCNFAKRKMSLEEFLALVNGIFHNYKWGKGIGICHGKS